MLETIALSKQFGGVNAVNGVSLTAEPGQRHAIIGPNGAGKSTLFNLIAGELLPTSGRILFNGRDITQLRVDQCANLGIGRTFQRNNLFLEMTALENIEIAVQHKQGIAWHPFRPRSRHKTAYACLEQVGLQEESGRKASDLAYGQQRALEIGLALATEPTLLLLDEPTAGMSPAETAGMVALIQQLPHTLTILIVEHDMDVIFSVADHVTVLHHGEKIATGTPDEMRNNQDVRDIYLGKQ